jgi:adenine-specific DNA-methyltransferase
MTASADPPQHSGRLELTWTDKDRRLLSFEDGTFQWTDPGDYRVSEVRLLHDVAEVGRVCSLEQRAGDNLLIRGDALHALTSLASIPEFADEYLGKVRLAYIDPPFNTGQAFAQYDDNLEHSIWLTMMRDRLVQISSLLSPDGSVWLHLDDVEVHRARIVLDEVFGSRNFVATIIWKKIHARNNSAEHFSTDHDYILVYAKDKSKFERNRLDRTAASDGDFWNPDGDPRGPWRRSDLTASHKYDDGRYEVVGPHGDTFSPRGNRWWSVSRETFEKLRADDRLWWGKTGRTFPFRKRFKSELRGLVPTTIWLNSEVGDNRQAKEETKTLSGGNAFATPKPERLLQRVIAIATEPGDIVLDCFAGSGTTAAVAHKMGRRWVTIEWSHNTIENFTMPRLQQVVEGKDDGGVTTVISREPVNELPDGATVSDAVVTVRFLSALVEASDLPGTIQADALTAVASAARQLAKTKKVVTRRWNGGGGFRVLDVGVTMFDEEDGQIFLASWAAGDRLAEAVAAQYNFEFQLDPPFCGRRGKERLAVIDGLVNDAVVDFLLGWLPQDELIVVFGTGVDPYAQQRLSEVHRGSTLEKIPEAIISTYRQVNRKANGLNWATPMAEVPNGVAK